MPSVHDILTKANNVNNNYLISIVDRMFQNGYFKEGKEELTDEHANRNYGKTIRWIERGNVPKFLRNDINDFVINERKIKNNELLRLPPPGSKID